MRKTIICIVGRTASGKDTIVKTLKENGLKPVVSYTTRPIRESEIEGREHYFIDEETAEKYLEDKNNIAAYTVIDGYKYFTTIDTLFNSHVYVIDPEGIEYLKEKHPEINLVTIYVKCSELKRLHYALDIRKDKESKFEKRRKAEDKQFSKFETEHNWTMCIENDSTLENLIKEAEKLVDYYKNNTNEFLNEYLMEMYPDDYENIIMFECSNYRSAVIGISDDKRLIYDYEKMIEHLIKYDGMDYDEAMEWIDFNTVRTLPYYPNGPIIMYPIEEV